MIPAYSPEARGRSERAFGTHQGRLPKELAVRPASRTWMRPMRIYGTSTCRRSMRSLPSRPGRTARPSCRARLSVVLDDILCVQVPRTVGKDNCVRLDGLVLQIPADRHRYHYIKARVTVCRHMDGTLSLFHGPRRLARYDAQGQLLQDDKSSGQTICTAAAARRVAPRDGRNELPTAA